MKSIEIIRKLYDGCSALDAEFYKEIGEIIEHPSNTADLPMLSNLLVYACMNDNEELKKTVLDMIDLISNNIKNKKEK